ncbi:hypothetical protein D3C85_1105830 [compost metagenome]
MDLAVAGDAPAHVARQQRAQLRNRRARQHAGIARQVFKGQRQAEVGHHADQAFFQAVCRRVVHPVRRHAAVQVVGGNGGPHEEEIVVEIVAMQQPARDRIEEGLGAFGLLVCAQQAHEFLFDLLPVSGLGVGQGGYCRAVAVSAAVAVVTGDVVQRAFRAAAQHAFQLRGAFAHAHVVVLDTFARQVLDAVPVARFKQRLGPLRAVAKQGVVAVKARQDQPRHVQRRRPRGGGLLDVLDVGHADHGGALGRRIRRFR